MNHIRQNMEQSRSSEEQGRPYGLKDHIRWSMRVKMDADGNEFATDTSVPQRDRDAFTYMADCIAE